MFCFFFLGYYGGHPIACSLWLCTFFKLKTFLAKVTKHTSADMLWITSAHALDYLCSCFKLPLYMIWITSAHALDHLCTCFELPLHMLWITSAHALDHLCTCFGSPLHMLWITSAHTLDHLCKPRVLKHCKRCFYWHVTCIIPSDC